MQANGAIAMQSIGFTVADMARSLDFYTNLLSFKLLSDREVSGAAFEQLSGLSDVTMRIVQLQLGDETIELTEYSPKGRPIPADSRSHDRTFQHMAIVVSDMAKAYEQLQQSLVKNTSTQPQKLPDWNEAVAGIQAFYFKDPDGHDLELIYFPPDKGKPKWQRETDELFLGIDHTAIVIADTDTSLTFYRNLLGLEVDEQTKNYGQEQEHLSRVPNAQIKITRLNPPEGPGIELLDYLTPQDGRPMPDDIRPNDAMHWQPTLVVKDAIALTEKCLTQPIAFVSSGVIKMPQEAGFQQGALVRDPDGHGLRLVEM